MILRIPLLFEGQKSEKRLYTLFDSGATYSCISDKLAASLSTLSKLRTPIRVGTAKDGDYIDIRHKVILDFVHDDIRMSDEFIVVPELSEEVIIGAHTMQKWHIKLDFKKGMVIINPNIREHFIRSVRSI